MPTTRTVTVKPSGGDYSSLSAAEAGEQGNLVTLDRYLVIECYAMNDSTACAFAGWTTDATRYISVIVPTAERHGGKYNTSKYYHSGGVEVSTNAINIEFIGLQFIRSGIVNQEASGILIGTASSGAITVRVDKCLFSVNGTGGSGGYYGISISDGNVVDTVTVTNCVFQDCYNTDYPTSGGAGAGLKTIYCYQLYLYNNTFYKNSSNVYWSDHASFTITAKNNLAAASRATNSDFVGTYDTASHNASSDGTAPGTSSRTNQTFTFVSTSGTYDLHLQSSDAGAKDYGVSDPGSGLYSDDIDGNTRSGSWDIGADEVTGGAATKAPPSVLFRPLRFFKGR